MAKKKQNSGPPQPPTFDRNFQLHKTQLIGIPVMLLIPILALLGMFGETDHEQTIANPRLEMQVTYPTRLRYKMIDAVAISLTNTSAQTIPTLQIEIDRSYVEGFSEVTFTPAIDQITGTVYIMELTDLQPGDTRVVSFAIQAEKYGKHQGAITVTPESEEALRVLIETLTFP